MFAPRAQNPTLAAALILTATAFIAASTLAAKMLTSGVLGPALHPLQVSHGRFLFAFLLFAGAAVVLRPGFGRINWGIHIGRSSCGWASVTLMFAAVTFIPMADATAISFLGPVFAMALAMPILRESVGPVRWLAAGVALAGALVLLRPTAASFQPAALLALGAAAVMGLAIASAAVWPVWQSVQGPQWAGLAAVGLLMACAQVAFIHGMARADASFVAPFAYGTLVFAALYDFAVFGVVPDWVSWLGAGIILSGALMLALREAQLRRCRA